MGIAALLPRQEGHAIVTRVRYRTIVADPPWPQRYSPRNSLGPHNARTIIPDRSMPYSSMQLEAIASLPLREWGHPDGFNVFLWATNSMLKSALMILDEWRAPFRQMVVWNKTNPSPFAGRGSFAPLDLEFLLIGRRGRAPFSGRMPRSVVVTAGTGGRLSDGSRKPEVFCDWIERLSPGPYLELFARRQRLGWDTWGDEALKHVEVPA